MKRKIKIKDSDKPDLISILDHNRQHSHWALKNKSGEIIWEEDVFEFEDSLYGDAPEKIKEKISNYAGCRIEDIKLFGSRITGGWDIKSDLDVAILDPERVNDGLFRVRILALNCEIRFVEDLNLSWLRDSI